MVIHDRKTSQMHICFDLRKLKDHFLHDPFPTPFTYEIFESIRGQEIYSFTDGFSGYHQIKLVEED